jgi:hypothetical protein
LKQIPIVRQGAGNQPAPYLFFLTTGRPVLMGLGKTTYGPFWQGKTPLRASRQAAASGSASGCNISCKWFASGDFHNHLQTISRQEIHGESLGIFQVGSHRFVGDYPKEAKWLKRNPFQYLLGNQISLVYSAMEMG